MFVEINNSNFKEVAAIYKQGIETGLATFETSIPTWILWNESHLNFGRIALKQNNEILGWASLAPVSKREVYNGVAEVSVYVCKKHRGNGVGKKLLNELIKISEKNNIWTLQSGIFRDNQASIKMHSDLGFRIIGFRERIAQLNGVWLDNIILERRSKIVGT